MFKSFVFSVCALVFAAACVAQNTFTASINVDGLVRDYRVYVPAVYNESTPVPLLINMHGYGSSAQEQEAYGDFRGIADTANFIVVHPNGTRDGGGSRHWGTLLAGPHADDVQFISDLIDTISAEFAIDLDRVYSVGMSNGGNMSYLLACNLSERIAAIASVTGFMSATERNNCQCTHPMPVMQVHGTSDGVIAYNGVGGIAIPVESLVNYWADFNGTDDEIISNVPNTNTADNSTAQRWDYANGDAGSEVVFYRVQDGGHTWPGSNIIVGTTNQDFDASIEIWRFFRPFSLGQVSSVADRVTSQLSLFPNPVDDKLNVRLPSNQQVNVTCFGINGNVYELDYQQKGTEVDIQTQNLATGVYFLEITQDGNRSQQRFVKR